MEKHIKKGRADLHIHSRYSRDSLSPLRSILKKARKQELDIIAITDHDVIKGAIEAQKIAPEFGVEVVIGEEISAKEGDVIALFVKEAISPGRTVLETVREIHKQQGLAVIPHPNNWFLGGVPTKTILNISDELDGIELLNGSWVGKIARKKNKKLNGSIFNLAPVGGSDAHLVSHVGCACTLFPGQSKADLYKAIKENLTLPDGAIWNYKGRFLWLAASPIIFCKRPLMTAEPVYRFFKKF